MKSHSTSSLERKVGLSVVQLSPCPHPARGLSRASRRVPLGCLWVSKKSVCLNRTERISYIWVLGASLWRESPVTGVGAPRSVFRCLSRAGGPMRAVLLSFLEPCMKTRGPGGHSAASWRSRPRTQTAPLLLRGEGTAGSWSPRVKIRDSRRSDSEIPRSGGLSRRLRTDPTATSHQNCPKAMVRDSTPPSPLGAAVAPFVVTRPCPDCPCGRAGPYGGCVRIRTSKKGGDKS